jgi:Cof subfamily protein (haloacid dehalogenase superfamily)
MTAAQPPIRLLVSDVDGTLVRPDKSLSPAVRAAADALRANGIRLAVVSSRATIGLDVLIGPLQLDTPRAGFNGAVILDPANHILHERVIAEPVCRDVVSRLEAGGLDIWVFADGRWLLKNEQLPYIEHERRSLNADYEVVEDFGPFLGRTHKVMGSSIDFAAVTLAETSLALAVGTEAAVHRSQLFHVDITHRDANKGTAALLIARALGIDPSEMACIGDMSNDLPMLDVAGLAIAMGNAPELVRRRAHAVVASNEKDGWAEAVERLILPRAPRPA